MSEKPLEPLVLTAIFLLLIVGAIAYDISHLTKEECNSIKGELMADNGYKYEKMRNSSGPISKYRKWQWTTCRRGLVKYEY